MRDTPIQWADDTVNPVMGCEGCELAMPKGDPQDRVCYTYIQHQFRGGNKGWAKDFFQPETFVGRLAKVAVRASLRGEPRPHKPWLNGLPRIVFVSDMGDALSDGIPFEFLKSEIVDTALGTSLQLSRQAKANAPLHQWLWLTKQPQRMAEFCRWLAAEHGQAWPSNLWAGTSVTSPGTVYRLDHLCKVGDERTIRFISAEPLWKPVSLEKHLAAGGIQWVIAGGESKQKSKLLRPPKPFELDWVRSLAAECRRFRVPLFVKQVGAQVTDGGQPFAVADSHGGDWECWPEDVRVREMPTLS